MARRQSLADRLDRLNRGCCPIHGGFMSQVDGWYYPDDSKPYTIVGCDWKACPARARAESFDGPWCIEEDSAFLLEEEVDWSRLPKPKRPRPPDPLPLWDEIEAKTGGRCFYCGVALNKTNRTTDHKLPRSHGGSNDLDNLVPACLSCNAAKGARSLEDLRFMRRMQAFEGRYGVRFSQDQLQFLASQGLQLRVPDHRFWFEKATGS